MLRYSRNCKCHCDLQDAGQHFDAGAGMYLHCQQQNFNAAFGFENKPNRVFFFLCQLPKFSNLVAVLHS